MVLVVPVTPNADVPIPPSRPSDLGTAPIPPSRPSDLGQTPQDQQAASQGRPALIAGMLDPVTLVINGLAYGGWETVEIEASSDEATREFKVKTSEPEGTWPIKPQDKVDVMVNGTDLIIRGFVDRYEAKLSPTEHYAEVSGKTESTDLVDSAAIHDTGRFRGKNLKEIGDEISKDVNIKIVDKTTKGLQPIERFQLQNGETIYDAMERGARSEDLMLVAAADGSLEIHDGPEPLSANQLVEGYFPVHTIHVILSSEDRHKKYKVRGQRSHTDLGPDLGIEEEEEDEDVQRNRTKIIIAEGDVDSAKAKKRARNEMTTQQGRAIEVKVICSGFYAPDGKLWRPLQQIYCKFPTVHLDQTMGVKSIAWKKSANNMTDTELTLVDPKALKGDGDDKSKSDPAYSLGKDLGDDPNTQQPAEPPQQNSFPGAAFGGGAPQTAPDENTKPTGAS